MHQRVRQRLKLVSVRALHEPSVEPVETFVAKSDLVEVLHKVSVLHEWEKDAVCYECEEEDEEQSGLEVRADLSILPVLAYSDAKLEVCYEKNSNHGTVGQLLDQAERSSAFDLALVVRQEKPSACATDAIKDQDQGERQDYAGE